MQHAPISRARYVLENRKMRFQEAYDGWSEGRLTRLRPPKHWASSSSVFAANEHKRKTQRGRLLDQPAKCS